jgi:hypothetical protein
MKTVVVDIETLPGPTYPDPSEVDPPANYKDPAKIKAFQQSKVDEVYRKQALDSMQGRILAIGVAVKDDPPVCFYNETGDDEQKILSELEDFLDEAGGKFAWVGHNVKAFDLQWIWRKAVKYNLPGLCDYIPRKRFDDRVIDTGELWAGPDYRAYCSLDKIAQFLGIPGKNGVDGSMIYDLWLAGEHEKIQEYCKSDVEITRSIYQKIIRGG